MTKAATEYQWGVFYKGRDLGYIPYESEEEARAEASLVGDKYAPRWLARRELGPMEFVSLTAEKKDRSP